MRINLPTEFQSITPGEIASAAREAFQPKRKWNKNKTLNWIDKEICESLLGTSYEVCAELWNLICPQAMISRSAQPKHLLWALFFMKNYATEEVSTRVIGGADKETFRDWCWIFIAAISRLKNDVILFSNRFRQWDNNTVCLISVDGTDCPVKEPRPFDTKIFSEKLNGPGLKYEVGVAIQTCDIVWINGPFKAGRPDKTIFKEDGLKAALCEDERVEVDRGYNGDDCLMNPDVAQSRDDRIQKGQVRGRHEIVNGRLKNFSIINDVFRTTGAKMFEKHGLAFGAVAVIVQLGFELHGHLYDVEYNANYN